ncbi:MAG: hypothetical protein ACYS21_01000 [Planctomycetota bacterium]|jgi:hypothetical protein
MFPATILTPVLIAGEDVPTIELYLISRQTVVEQQPDDPRYSNVKIDGRYPIVPVRFEMTPELTYFAPALKVVVGVSAFLERHHLGQVPKKQRERPSGTHYSDGHVMLIQHKDITVQAGSMLGGNHNSKSPS